MNLNLTTATRIGLNLLALLGVSIALWLGRSIFIPLTIAVLLAAILYPAARRLTTGLLMPWFLSCLTIIIALVVVQLVIIFSFAAAVPKMLEDLPKPNNVESQKAFYKRFVDQVKKASPVEINDVIPDNPDVSGAFLYISKYFNGEYITTALLQLTGTGLELIAQGVLVLFILLFLLLEGDMLANKVRAIFGMEGDTQTRVTGALAEMAEAVRKYLVWRTIVNIGLAVVLGGLYHALGLRQATLWAVLTAIFSYVPYLGTIAAGALPVLDAFLNVGAGQAIGIMVFYIGLVTFEGYIIVPWVMGRSMDLNATTVMLACLFWYLVWGISGLFVAMPLMAAVKAVCLHVEGWNAWGKLMSSEPTLPVEYFTGDKQRTHLDSSLGDGYSAPPTDGGHAGGDPDDKKSRAPF